MRQSILRLLAVLTLAGCTKGTPKFADLNPSQIPRPTFSGSTKFFKTITSPSLPVLIQGECDTRIKSLSFQLVGFKDWSAAEEISTGAVDTQCEDGRFQFSLKSMAEFGHWDASRQQSFTIEVRGSTVVGMSLASEFIVQYIPSRPLNPAEFRISSGTQISSRNGYITEGAVVPLSKTGFRSSNYIVHGNASK